MYDASRIESLGKPVAAIVNEEFLNDARSAASIKGVPALRLVHEKIAPDEKSMAKIEPRTIDVMDNIIAALTGALTAEELVPTMEEERPARIVFRGDLQEVNQFFYRRGWGDGLPIYPSTEEAVAEMLTGTDLPAEHVVAKIIPRLGKATVEKIAINAVMAGALPTHMPVLIAAVQAIVDPEAYFGLFEVSTCSFAPFLVVNGPIRRELNINCSSGTLSPGDIANSAIGRALSLIIKNVGGARKGVEDMGAHGNPGKHGMVVAENEEASPWEPLHVEQGLSGDDSAVSLVFSRGYYALPAYGTEPQDILQTVIYNVPPDRPGTLCVLMNRTYAEIMAEAGWTKQDVKEFIAEHTRSPLYQYNAIFAERDPKARYPLKAMDSIGLFTSPQDITICVSGGPGNFLGLTLTGHSWKRPRPVTRKVETPKNWEQVVRKYQNLVPRYARY
ncbi:MAG: hypothetical protein HY675_18860 [Chloroflexi bacterium]|nr:hypothetical protein [Chloroflexota bacterium]